MGQAGWYRLDMVYWDNIEEPHLELDFIKEENARKFLGFLLKGKLIKAGTVYEIAPFGSQPVEEDADYLVWFVKELEKGPEHLRQTMKVQACYR